MWADKTKLASQPKQAPKVSAPLPPLNFMLPSHATILISRFQFLLMHTYLHMYLHSYLHCLLSVVCLCFGFCLFTFIAHPFWVLFRFSVWQVQRVFDLIVCSVAQFEVINIETDVRWRQRRPCTRRSQQKPPCPILPPVQSVLIFTAPKYTLIFAVALALVVVVVKKLLQGQARCMYVDIYTDRPRELA